MWHLSIPFSPSNLPIPPESHMWPRVKMAWCMYSSCIRTKSGKWLMQSNRWRVEMQQENIELPYTLDTTYAESMPILEYRLVKDIIYRYLTMILYRKHIKTQGIQVTGSSKMSDKVCRNNLEGRYRVCWVATIQPLHIVWNLPQHPPCRVSLPPRRWINKRQQSTAKKQENQVPTWHTKKDSLLQCFEVHGTKTKFQLLGKFENLHRFPIPDLHLI